MNIKNGFNYAKKVISTGADMVVVLDEMLGLLDLHLISKEELSDMLASRPDDVTVIMTGRVLDDGIREWQMRFIISRRKNNKKYCPVS